MIDTMLDWLNKLTPSIVGAVIGAIVGGCIWLATH